MEEIIKLLEERVKWIEENDPEHDKDSASWNYEEGVVISINQAKEILSILKLDYDKDLSARKAKFLERCMSFEKEYALGMIQEFFDYWSEGSENAKKMRYEKQKVFDISLRLKRWKKNQFPSKNTSPHNIDTTQVNYDKKL